MPVTNYGVWKGKPVRYTYEDRHKDNVSPHLSLYYTDDQPDEGRAAINIKSQGSESRLAYWTVPSFDHPLTTDLPNLPLGFKLLSGNTSDQNGLDFIRGNLFDRTRGRVLPHDVDGPDNDILDQLKPILDRAISRSAIIYLFGSAFSLDNSAGGNNKGIHNNHMNQGNTGRWTKDNGVYQDGGLIIQFPDDNHWEAVFIAFASQAVHTDDGVSDEEKAGDPLPPNDFLTWADFLAPEVPPDDRDRHEIQDSPVRITSALVNPPGDDGQPGVAPETVTLTNRTDGEVDLGGWSIRNGAGDVKVLGDDDGEGGGVRLLLGGGSSLTVEVGPRVPLSNKGGTITLLDRNGLKVDGVSYSKEQARRGTVSWD